MENDNDISIWYFVAFGAIFLIIRFIYEKRRSESLLLAANSLGMSFNKSGRDNTYQIHNGFYLFSKGYGRKIKNEIWGELDGILISIFGYEYTTSSGKNSTTYKQTVLSIQCKPRELPSFILRPESIFHKIVQIFGYKDIDFDSNFEFSKKYLLRGHDEEAIRKIFTKNVLGFFESNTCLCVESKNNLLLLYRDSDRCKPSELKKFLGEGKEVYKMLSPGDYLEPKTGK